MATPQEALDAAYKSWNAGDLDGYLCLYDEGIALHGYSPEPMNKDQVRGFYQGIFSAFGTPKLEFHEVLWDGDVAAIRFTMTGRHVDEVAMVIRTGHRCRNPGERNGHRTARHHHLALPRRPGHRALLPGGYAGPAGPGGGRAGVGLNQAAGLNRRAVGMGDRSACRP
jgi:hypothetical protein